jgi:hypothetical protein
MAPQTGSPAIGAGNLVGAPDTDQRGVTRPQQGAIDIGAFEATLPTSPTLFPSPAELPATTVGVPYSQTITASASTKSVTGQFTSDADGLSFSEGTNSLTISGTPTTAGVVTFTVTATDANNATTTLNYSLTVNGPITFSPDPSTLPDPVVNTSYPLTFITASGGTGAKTLGYAFTSGSNADGLSFTPFGTSLLISGKPTAAGTISFEVIAVDAVGATATRSYTLTVDAVGQYPITISPASLPDAIAGVPYFQEIDASNGTSDKTMTLTPAAGTTLPAWLNVNNLNTDRLFISGTPPTAGSVSFDVTATDATGASTKQSYTLTIDATFPALSITTQPRDQTVAVGANVSFTAVANGNPMPTVQWQVSTDGANWSNIDKATSTTLTLNNVGADLSGNQYRAVFYNGVVADAISDAALLTVDAETTAAPAVTGNPTPQTVTAGQTATFTASASGTPTPMVQWQVNSGGGWSNITDNSTATTDTLTLSNVTADMDGWEYQAVFSNGVGNPAATNAATLTVNSAPTISSSPSNAMVTAGQTATFTAAASGNPMPTVQWQVSTDSGKTFSTITDNSTATTETLTLSNVTTAMSGWEYQAVFSNGVGDPVTTSAAMLTVNPAITLSPSGGSLTAGAVGVPYNQTFTASGGTGNKTLSITSGSLPAGLTVTPGTNQLTISGKPTDSGNFSFTVTATDSLGAQTAQSYTLRINQHDITLSPSGSLTIGSVGKLYIQSITASGGSGPLTVTYQFAPGSSMPPGLTFFVLGNRLMILGAPLACGAGTVTFAVTVQDKAGDIVTQNYTLTINPAAPIALNPTTLPTGSVGKSYSQSITASGGSGPLTVTYQLAPGSSMPAGLRFTVIDNRLMISSKPRVAGTVAFTVTAKDIFGDSSTQSYTLTVSASGATTLL